MSVGALDKFYLTTAEEICNDNFGLNALAALVGTAALLVPFVSAAQTAPEKNTCLFYENTDYKGAFWAVQGDALTTKPNVKPESVYKRDFKGRVLCNRNGTEGVIRERFQKLQIDRGACVGKYADAIDKDIPKFSAQFNDNGVGFWLHM